MHYDRIILNAQLKEHAKQMLSKDEAKSEAA